jgi:(1->4)-alpha-D-glucan 1-alpha-D-glucosylmutase
MRREIDGGAAPDAADEIMLYEMLVGAWLPDVVGDVGVRALAERIAVWQLKALREAKRFTAWIAPDEAYEAACTDFLHQILDPSRSSRLWEEIAAFAQRIGPAGAINGLAQTVLRLTTPGVPDLYQGTDLWDGSLVDPDNRRAVDYALRADMLAVRKSPVQLLPEWQSGQLKQSIIARALHLRQALPVLFGGGNYQPLAIEGDGADHLLAFAREADTRTIITVVTIHAASLLGDHDLPHVPADRWQETSIVLPDHLGGARFTNVFDDTTPIAAGGRLSAGALLTALPVALLTCQR